MVGSAHVHTLFSGFHNWRPLVTGTATTDVIMSKATDFITRASRCEGLGSEEERSLFISLLHVFYIIFALPHSLVPSLLPSLARSLTQSLTISLTLSVTH